MQAKVIKEMLEQKNGIAVEYLEQTVSGNRVTFSFSQTPRFVNLSILRKTSGSNYVYFANIPWLSVDSYVYYKETTDTMFVRWSGSQLQISYVDGTQAYAIAFF